jgi:adenylate kinase family enzyme
MRIAFIGPVGAGKTAQAGRLARALPYYNPRVSTGEIVRAHIEAGTERPKFYALGSRDAVEVSCTEVSGR